MLLAIALRMAVASLNTTYALGVLASHLRLRWCQLAIYATLVTVIIARSLQQQGGALSARALAQGLSVPVLWCFVAGVALHCAVRFPRRGVYAVRAAIAVVAASWLVLRSPPLREACQHVLGPLAPVDVAPLGASYALLKVIHVLLDAQAKRSSHVRQSTLLAMLLFPPTFAAGPIHRYEAFAESFERIPPLRTRDWDVVVRRFVWGTFKTSVVGAYCLSLCGPVLACPSAFGPIQAWIALYGYAAYIYVNFSGVTDIAIGIGAAFGVGVPENFARPYLQPDIQAFWRCWHMTFTRWLQAYIFMPLSRKLMTTRLRRSPRVVSTIGYLVTFVVCGFWHGNGVNFVLWGLWHGVGLALYTSLPARLRAPAGRGVQWSSWRSVAWWLATVHFVALGWVLFACPAGTAALMFRRLLGLS